jgi:hypothetical protein
MEDLNRIKLVLVEKSVQARGWHRKLDVIRRLFQNGVQMFLNQTFMLLYKMLKYLMLTFTSIYARRNRERRGNPI